MPLVDCKECNAKGKIVCPRCNGKGMIKYGFLKEMSKTCYDCKGEGSLRCGNCKGIGIIEIIVKETSDYLEIN